MATTPTAPGHVRLCDGSEAAHTGHIGLIVAGSLAIGLIAALLLTAAPFISPQENDVTGATLCGFAVGWVVLVILSTSNCRPGPPRTWSCPTGPSTLSPVVPTDSTATPITTQVQAVNDFAKAWYDPFGTTELPSNGSCPPCRLPHAARRMAWELVKMSSRIS